VNFRLLRPAAVAMPALYRLTPMKNQPKRPFGSAMPWQRSDFEQAGATKDATEVPQAPASLYRRGP
jgi:hypothetical protein